MNFDSFQGYELIDFIFAKYKIMVLNHQSVIDV